MTIDVHIKVEGVAEYKAGLRAMLARLDIASRTATREAAETLQSRIREVLHETEHPPHTPTVSQPGTPPSWVTGRLSNSVHIEGPLLETTRRWTCRVGPTAVHGRIQELGGHSGRPRVYLPPRPYVTPVSLELALSGRIRRSYLVRWERVILGA